MSPTFPPPRSRFESTRTVYAVGAVVVLLGLVTTPAIKTTEKGRG